MLVLVSMITSGTIEHMLIQAPPLLTDVVNFKQRHLPTHISHITSPLERPYMSESPPYSFTTALAIMDAAVLAEIARAVQVYGVSLSY